MTLGQDVIAARAWPKRSGTLAVEASNRSARMATSSLSGQ